MIFQKALQLLPICRSFAAGEHTASAHCQRQVKFKGSNIERYGGDGQQRIMLRESWPRSHGCQKVNERVVGNLNSLGPTC